MVTDINQLDFSKTYTYADYLTWQFEERVELIKGQLFRMSPAPSRRHQRISLILSNHLFNHFKKEACQVYTAPFDVRLPDRKKSQKADREILTVVQPDICVICDREKLDDKGCLGAPDWIIEILSPGNTRRELNEKFRLYQDNGVQEYWIVQPGDMTVTALILENGRYQLQKIYSSDEIAYPALFPALPVDLTEVFAD